MMSMVHYIRFLTYINSFHEYFRLYGVRSNSFLASGCNNFVCDIHRKYVQRNIPHVILKNVACTQNKINTELRISH